ncbi:MAG: hypothetical protein WD178_04725, partial [Actinomycetota bacterium]
MFQQHRTPVGRYPASHDEKPVQTLYETFVHQPIDIIRPFRVGCQRDFNALNELLMIRLPAARADNPKRS